MGSAFADSAGKRTVRENWDTPLLRYLHETYGFRYRYFGLPGEDCHDVRLWRDMIDEVIAFEVPAKKGVPTSTIVKLRSTLEGLNLPTYNAYYGAFESVVTSRLAFDGTPYKPSGIITLYNLDFCNRLDSKIPTPRGEELLRFAGIRQILLDQAEQNAEHQRPWFILMITVRHQMSLTGLSGIVHRPDVGADVASYVASCLAHVPLNADPATGQVKGQHAWAFKAGLFDLLRGYLKGPHIEALFFPLVKYIGKTESSPMLHWLLFCQFGRTQQHSPAFHPAGFLTDVCSLRADDQHNLVADCEPCENTTEPCTGSVAWFKQHSSRFVLPPTQAAAAHTP